MLFPQHFTDYTESQSLQSFENNRGGAHILFGASLLSVSAFLIIPTAGSRHDTNIKSELSRLRSHACMIEFPVSETDEGTNREMDR